MKKYDYLVIGGGIFGLYTALYLAKNNKKVCVLEKENQFMKKASIVNQARLHAGYHYPRSVATALLSNEYKERFILEHKNFINSKYDKYYAIDKYGSLTNSVQFEKFCNYINIKCKKVDSVNYLKNNRIEQLYLTEEYSFDPIMIAEYYKEMINQNSNIYAKMNTTIVEAETLNDSWSISIYDSKENDYNKIEANSVINATYYNINTQNIHFGCYTYTIGPTYETLSEIQDIKSIGGDVVGMSTFPEFLMCEKLNMNYIIISCLTNYGAGITKEKVEHSDVLENALKYKENFCELVINLSLDWIISTD